MNDPRSAPSLQSHFKTQLFLNAPSPSPKTRGSTKTAFLLPPHKFHTPGERPRSTPSRSDGSGRPQDRTSSHSGDPRNPVGRVRERPIPPGWCSSERPLGTQAPGLPKHQAARSPPPGAPRATLRAVSGAKRLFPGARTPRGTWRSPLKQQPSRAHHAPGGRRPAAHLLAPPPRGTPPSFPAALFQLLPAGRRAQLTLPRAGLERWGGDDPSADRAQQVRSPCRPVQPVCQDFAQNFSARAAGE